MLYMKMMMSYFESLVKLLIAAMFVMAIASGSAFASENADEPATDPAPVVEVVKEAPAAEPVAEVKAEPVVETPAPAAETPAPVVETPAPAADPAPVAETPAPAAEPAAPAAEPVAEVVSEPVAEMPAVEAPVAETPAAEAPAAESEAAAPVAKEAAAEAAAPAAAAATAEAPKAATTTQAAKTTKTAKSETVLKTAAAATTKVLGKDIVAKDGVFEITESGNYSLTGESKNRVSIIGQIQVYLQLIGAKINAGANASAISLSQGASAEITIEGECELAGKHGIAVPEGTSLTVIGNGGRDGSDSLIATGNGAWGCGIGYYEKGGTDAGNITIKNLNSVIATGGKYGGGKKDEGGVGIGGGRHYENNADQGVIVIDNVDSVIAHGGSLAAGIGAGFWKACDIYINNSTIDEAVGGSSAPGIGGGRNVIQGGTDSIVWDDEKEAYVVTNKALVTNIEITDSKVYAYGGGTSSTGEGGAGIGVGYVDLSVGDFGRAITLIENKYGKVVGSDVMNPEVHIVIDGKSDVYAKGGIMSAGIGGGYKASVSSILIGGEATVEAVAGDTGSTNAKAVPCAIGSGAGGSGVFSDADGSITIESGAKVIAYGYGFEKIGSSRLAYTYDGDRVLIDLADGYEVGDISHFINDKWAIGLGFDTSDMDSSIVVFRFLNRDFFKELLDGYEAVNTSDNMILVLTNADGEESARIPLKAGYGSIAFTLPEGLYGGTIGFLNDDGSVSILDKKLTALPVTGYSAITDGSKTGKQQTVFYGGGDSSNPDVPRTIGDYIDFNHNFYSWDSTTDVVDVHYAYGSYLSLLTFEVKKGINAYDAVAMRPLGTLTIDHEFAIDGDDANIPDTLEFVVTGPDGVQRVFKYSDIATGQGSTIATAGTVRLVIEDAVPGTYTVTERGWDVAGYKHTMNINGAEAVSGESSYQIEFVWNDDKTLRSVSSATGSYVDIYTQEAFDPETPGNTETDPTTPTNPTDNPQNETVVPTPATDPTDPEEETTTDVDPTPADDPAETPVDEPTVNTVTTPNAVTPIVAGGVPLAFAAIPAATPATAIPDDATPLAPAAEAIEDEGTPMGAFDSEDENCWVHWWIMLGMALTALYGAAVAFRRQRNSSNLQKMDDEVMGKEEESVEAAAPTMAPQPAL